MPRQFTGRGQAIGYRTRQTSIEAAAVKMGKAMCVCGRSHAYGPKKFDLRETQMGRIKNTRKMQFVHSCAAAFKSLPLCKPHPIQYLQEQGKDV